MELRNVHERHTVMIRTTTSVDKLPELMGRSFGEIMQYLAPRGVHPAGPPFTMYHNMDLTDLDVEVGFPVSQCVEGKGEINAGTLPAGRVAYAVHVGPYERISDTYDELYAWVRDQGLEPQACFYECYLNSPEDTAEEGLETEIYLPVK